MHGHRQAVRRLAVVWGRREDGTVSTENILRAGMAGTGKPARLLSLDVFRGATVAAMILVNNPGSWGAIYPPLEHAEWHGCTPTDLIMPFFLFIVGVSIVYALDSKRADSASQGGLIWKIAKRAAVLFGLGIVLALFPGSPDAVKVLFSTPLDRLDHLRIMGVLQRIAVVYLVCAVLFLKTPWRVWLWSCAAIVVGYFLALTVVPVPVDSVASLATTRTGTATTAPAIGTWMSANLQPATNLAAVIDRNTLGSRHLYKGGPMDPEGPFSTISAIASGLIGVLAGYYLKRGRGEITERIAWLFTAGLALAAAGWLWGYFHPLNKQLWTSSFTLLTGGLAAMLLAATYWVHDVRGIKRGTGVFLWFGVNAIAAFWGSGLMVRAFGLVRLDAEGKLPVHTWFYRNAIASWVSPPELASLAYAVLFLCLWTAIVWLMWKMKWIVKV